MAERARAASYNLLVEMGNAVIRWSEDQTGKFSDITEFSILRLTFHINPELDIILAPDN